MGRRRNYREDDHGRGGRGRTTDDEGGKTISLKGESHPFEVAEEETLALQKGGQEKRKLILKTEKKSLFTLSFSAVPALLPKPYAAPKKEGKPSYLVCRLSYVVKSREKGGHISMTSAHQKQKRNSPGGTGRNAGGGSGGKPDYTRAYH